VCEFVIEKEAAVHNNTILLYGFASVR